MQFTTITALLAAAAAVNGFTVQYYSDDNCQNYIGNKEAGDDGCVGAAGIDGAIKSLIYETQDYSCTLETFGDNTCSTGGGSTATTGKCHTPGYTVLGVKCVK